MNTNIRLLRAALPQAGKTALKKISRRILKLRLDLTGADAETRLRAERRQRGREQVARLERADAVVVSFAKSGRTWLRVMISRLYSQVYDLPEDVMIGFDNFHNLDRRVPRIFFTHDNYIADYTGNTDSKADFYDKKVVLLMRDPRDVAVSQIFHLRFRTSAEKKMLNDYPPHEDDDDLFAAVCHEGGGLPRIIDFMNLWAREMPRVRALELLRYEDLRADPLTAMTRLARFLDIPASQEQIRDAVDFASYDNLKKKEADQSFRMSGGRLKPVDADNPDTYKVRRGKVGGYRDYFDDAEVRTIDKMVAESLDPVYGYAASEKAE